MSVIAWGLIALLGFSLGMMLWAIFALESINTEASYRAYLISCGDNPDAPWRKGKPGYRGPK